MCYFHIKGWNVFYIDIASIWSCCIFWEWVVICFIIGVVIIQVLICNFPFFEIFLCFCTINTTIYLSYFLWNPPLSLIICVRFWTMFFAIFFFKLIHSFCLSYFRSYFLLLGLVRTTDSEFHPPLCHQLFLVVSTGNIFLLPHFEWIRFSLFFCHLIH